MAGRDASSKDAMVRSQLVKTELCSFYMGGHCAKGKRCQFAHGLEELQPHPDLSKTSLCLNWKRSRCRRAAGECPYAHGEQELRKTTGPRERALAARAAEKLERAARKDHSTKGLSEASTIASTSGSTTPPPQDKAAEASSKARTMEELTRRLAQMAFAPVIERQADLEDSTALHTSEEKAMAKHHEAFSMSGAGPRGGDPGQRGDEQAAWLVWRL